MAVVVTDSFLPDAFVSESAPPQQRARAYLREQILAGNFPAGMRLKPEEIASKLGVSRMPVRDALQQLHSEGLVVIRPNRGAVVTSLTSNEVLELFEIRAALEGLAARHACEHYTDDVMTQLELMLRGMNDALDDLPLWLERHDLFHETLLAPSGRRRLLMQIRNSRQAVLPYVRLYIAIYDQIEMPSAEHAMLLSIARRGNPDLFEATVRDHVLSAGRGVTSFLRKHEADMAQPEPRKAAAGKKERA
jgi:DNA-binding GntR family transcriptional regulator